jgi:hypothetical protein
VGKDKLKYQLDQDSEDTLSQVFWISQSLTVTSVSVAYSNALPHCLTSWCVTRSTGSLLECSRSLLCIRNKMRHNIFCAGSVPSVFRLIFESF